MSRVSGLRILLSFPPLSESWTVIQQYGDTEAGFQKETERWRQTERYGPRDGDGRDIETETSRDRDDRIRD